MRRRELLLLLAGGIVPAQDLRAQQKPMPVIGFLSSVSPGPTAPYMAAFHQGLRETGYVEGHRTWLSNTAGQTAIMIDFRQWLPISSTARST
jgi:hypothetical protein